jgi:sirohydrochlorin ferrochelatase
MMVSESDLDDASETAAAIALLVDFDVNRVASGRLRGKDRKARVDAAVGEIRRFSLPEWTERWAAGKADLIRVDPEFR